MSTEKNLYASRNKKKPKQDGDMRTLVFLQLPGSEQLDLRLAALSSLSLAPWARLHSWLAGNMIQFSQSQPHRAFLASSGQSRLAQGRRATRLELEVCSSIFKIGTWLPRPTPLMLTGPNSSHFRNLVVCPCSGCVDTKGLSRRLRGSGVGARGSPEGDEQIWLCIQTWLHRDLVPGPKIVTSGLAVLILRPQNSRPTPGRPIISVAWAALIHRLSSPWCLRNMSLLGTECWTDTLFWGGRPRPRLRGGKKMLRSRELRSMRPGRRSQCRL